MKKQAIGRRNAWIRGLVVAGLAGAGVAMMAGGLLAWVMGEGTLFVAGTVAGAVFIGAGGLGMLHCLDQNEACSRV